MLGWSEEGEESEEEEEEDEFKLPPSLQRQFLASDDEEEELGKDSTGMFGYIRVSLQPHPFYHIALCSITEFEFEPFPLSRNI